LEEKSRAPEELTRKNLLLAEQLSAPLAENEQLKLQKSTEDEDLKEQLGSALSEIGELKKYLVYTASYLMCVCCSYCRNSSLQLQLRLLAQQLAQKEQQKASLQKELSIYQHLLGDQKCSSPLSRGKDSHDV